MPSDCKWAAILAGGDGRRLQSFTRMLTGEARPKQFCRLFGSHTLLEDTRKRVSLNVESARTLYVVSRPHEVFYGRELADARRWQLIEQPSNAGTTAGVAYAISRLQALDAHGLVGFFPADHYYRDAFTMHRTVDAAYALASINPDKVVLIGAEASRPETEYGWIEPGATIQSRRMAPIARMPLSSVRRFCEKPSAGVAAELLSRGCLWNTMVVVGRIRAFEHLLSETTPAIWDAFEVIRQAADPQQERASAEALYASLDQSDFSRNVLAARPDRLAVLSLPECGWTDLGQPHRVLDVLADRNEVLEVPRVAAN